MKSKKFNPFQLMFNPFDVFEATDKIILKLYMEPYRKLSIKENEAVNALMCHLIGSDKVADYFAGFEVLDLEAASEELLDVMFPLESLLDCFEDEEPATMVVDKNGDLNIQ